MLSFKNETKSFRAGRQFGDWENFKFRSIEEQWSNV